VWKVARHLDIQAQTKAMLWPDEKVITDRGYKGEFKAITPYDPLSEAHGKLMNTARARHETINGTLKVWMILKDLFWHAIAKHHIAFCAVLVLEQIKIENGHPPFQVQDLDDPIQSIYYFSYFLHYFGSNVYAELATILHSTMVKILK
jgi:hypothetical protein